MPTKQMVRIGGRWPADLPDWERLIEKPLRDLYARCACSQPMFSQQVRLLEQQGLIRTRKEGTAKYCALRNPDFLKLFICLDRHLREVLNIKEKE